MKVNVPDQCEMQMKVKMRYENRRGPGAVGITRCLASDIVTESPECSTQDEFMLHIRPRSETVEREERSGDE